MCGIFASFLKRPLLQTDIELGRQATNAIRHRGPDAEGEWTDTKKGVYLGHRRLSIIDLSSASNQPMRVDEHVIIYNGETYNFPSLKNDLEARGLKFKSRGDVEVVLKGWQSWQDGLFDRVDGMFAFAIWNGHQGVVATDAFGEKPLFYAETDDGLYFCSEIPPLASLLGLKPEMSEETLAAYLALGFVPPPKTGYSTIKRVGAAKRITIENGRIVSEKTYWRPPIAKTSNGKSAPLSEDALTQLQEVICDSVGVRLIADVPISIFLSRGVDSALVAAMASRDHKATPQCLSVSYPMGDTVDEASDAKRIAEYLGLEHETIVNITKAENASPASILEILHQPSEGITMLSLRQMSEAAAKDFKVALTGSGGDEVTFGYGKNAYFHERRQMYGVPEVLRRSLGLMARPFMPLDDRITRYVKTVAVRDDETYIAYKNQPAIDWLRQLPGFRGFCQNIFTSLDPLDVQSAHVEWEHVMPGLRLPNLDHGSMNASLELRTPFLSRKLVEKVAEFDPGSFMGYGQKSVLRRILARYLPEQLFNHPKSGFVFPPDIFLHQRGPVLPVIPNLDPKIAQQVWERRFDGKGWTRIAVRMAIADEFFK
jgi:asparagine synthase (glutamine-hydrolysing)